MSNFGDVSSRFHAERLEDGEEPLRRVSANFVISVANGNVGAPALPKSNNEDFA
jgi:hypothetical protein